MREQIFSAIALLLLSAAPAGAQLRLRVRAHTHLELDSIQRTESGVVVRGHLTDASTDEHDGARPVDQLAEPDRHARPGATD